MQHNSQQPVADTRDPPPEYTEVASPSDFQPVSTSQIAQGWSQPPNYLPPPYSSQYGAEYGIHNASYKSPDEEQPYTITAPPNYHLTYIQQPLHFQAPIKNYLAVSILSLFLFFPTAIVAIVKANDAQNEYQSGNIASARENNKVAMKFVIISLRLGIMIWTIVGFLCTYRHFVYRYD